MERRTKTVKAGDWRTLESFWNVTTTGFFQAPSGARIRVKYGGGWFSVTRQLQTLDGTAIKTLKTGLYSLTYARMQIRVERDTTVTYIIAPGNVSGTITTDF